MPNLSGRTALVFGAGCVGVGWGNGNASACAYADAGAHVFAADRDIDAARATVGLIEARGRTATALSADVLDAAAMQAAVAMVLAERGQIDVLHNNVGHAGMGGPIELTEEEWDRQISLNLKGVFLACKYVLPEMLHRGRGAIVNISSLASIRYTGYPYAAYYAAKAAVNQLTVGLALQYAGQGIRANAVLPGLMDTPMIHQAISGQYDSSAEMIAARNATCPMGRMGTAWDVARAAVFLASDDAAYITGVCLPVDGGLSCRAA